MGPLTAHADHVLRVDALENTDAFTPAVSRIGALVMIDILATAVALGREPAHLTRLAAMKQTLADARRR
jgi:RpiR family carbohydrate utilization transcriptional regulator